MIGNIIGVEGNLVTIKLVIDINKQTNLIGVHTIFESDGKLIVGEISSLGKETGKIAIIGEIVGDTFIPGVISKPSFKSLVRIIKMPELEIMLGKQEVKDINKFLLGYSSIYTNYKINIPTNKFFSNHFAVLGNTGSGKSCSVARIIQNIFTTSEYLPVRSKFMIFDAYGEYVQAFANLSAISPMINTKVYTTDIKDKIYELLRIPLWLLDVDDIALLLGATTPLQLPIIEKALKLAPVFKGTSEEVVKLRNDIISRAILDILRSGNSSTQIRDQVTAILSTYKTDDLNLESEIHQPGYTRTLKQCLYVDNTGKMAEMELVVEFFQTFVVEGLELPDPDGSIMYNLKDLEKSLDFALISEGVLQSEKVFDYANVLSVRLHSLINSTASLYFEFPSLITKDQYVASLFLTPDSKPAQIVNININYVDDRLGKSIVKIISRMVFQTLVASPIRGAVPIHIVIEEAHRYVQNDNDVNLLGYNIFDRITKEGRKYGAILGLITQRPSELSETAISQCTNFVILRTMHPKDLKYIEEMVPNITEDGIKQIKGLQPGNALVFGSAFPVPLLIKFELPNPQPLSANSDIVKIWFNQE